MEWVTVDAALAEEGLSAAELAAVSNCGADWQAALQGVCMGLAARVRNACMASGRVQALDPRPVAVPAALRAEVVDVLRYRLLLRFALRVTDERKEAATAAEARLDALARGEYPLVDSPAAAAPTYHGRPHRFQSPQRGGLL